MVDGETKKTFPVKAWVDEKILAEGLKMKPELIGSIDNGTSSTRFLLFTPQGKIGASAQVEYTQYFPSGEDKSGWHEHDPVEIWESVVTCIQAVLKELEKAKIKDRPIAAIGITNQRETTIAWDADTGVPYYNAIVWDDLRTTGIADEIAQGNADRFRGKTGLPLASYFAGTKVKWLVDNVPQLRQDLRDREKSSSVRFGTVDSWLLYQLTGTKSRAQGAANFNGMFATDVSNASRWLFLDLKTVQWDQGLVDAICSPHKVPLSALPTIMPSSHHYGVCQSISEIQGVPLTAILGDQQAALFGQCAFDAGKAKCTYGTGLFLMKNTGTRQVASTHGMLTTVAYQIGQKGKVYYALEGSVSHSGSTIQWLRDKLNIIQSAPESESLAKGTQSNEGLYLVPAFAGLFAPHWRSDARACIVGMTASHHKGHICRAALEAACYQAREVFEAIVADSPFDLKSLSVDGGATENRLMMQFQSDMLDLTVIRPEVGETTALGAAFAAGLAVGVWKDLEELNKLRAIKEKFQPSMDARVREKNWQGWQKAVSRSLGWIDSDAVEDTTERAGSLAEMAPYVALTGLALGVGFLLGQRNK
ncbi:Glycerol kinase [Seminavis robusta]|uniref:glycerol kinase n=1 Tax=Seminavis robusta TaxID=568900 RepID=A0A9N8DV04_9STRA|nr:Glycerol kinase [Seminavis robusta]|eukprot:Sro379_g130520.1 Glycerol kinase (590) ;mRNA; f:52198-54151